MQKFIVGLTGPTGAGKSTAVKVAKELGFFCIDADKVARKATEKGSPLLPLLMSEFGDILNADGSLNRTKLAEVGFSDKSKTEALNKIMLPYIVSLIENIIIKSDSRLILLDAPTLFEAGADKICNKTVGVLADRQKRKKRILLRDNITDELAEKRINAGKQDSFYTENCDFIIYNNSTEQNFLGKATTIFESLVLEAK